jgi:hypothetical protein
MQLMGEIRMRRSSAGRDTAVLLDLLPEGPWWTAGGSGPSP